MRYKVLILLIVCIFCTFQVVAESRARLNPEAPSVNTHSSSDEVLQAISLPRGGVLKISSMKGFTTVDSLVSKTIQETHKSLESSFGPISNLNVKVKLYPEDIFFATTGAPSWTNALFFKDTILLPVRDEMNKEDLMRSVRHEFTHAVIHDLSNGNAPGWLDEGLAQVAEGRVHPLIKKALFDWTKNNPTIPFYLLQNGFTKLDTKYVVPAYGESLWAAKYLGSQFGKFKLRYYFDLLAKKSPQPFKTVFGITESEFEEKLSCLIKDPICREIPEQLCRRCS